MGVAVGLEVGMEVGLVGTCVGTPDGGCVVCATTVYASGVVVDCTVEACYMKMIQWSG